MREAVSVALGILGSLKCGSPPPSGKRARVCLTIASRQVRRVLSLESEKGSTAGRLPAALTAAARGRRLAAAVGGRANLRRPARIEDPGQPRPGSSSRRRAIEPPGAAEDQGQAEGACLLQGAGNEVVKNGGHVDGHGGPPEMRKPALRVRTGFARGSEDRRRAAFLS